MKVMCIDDSLNNPYAIIIPFGEIVTASQSLKHHDVYDIAEYPLGTDGRSMSYYKWRFAPLSNIDEMELLEQRQNQLQEL